MKDLVSEGFANVVKPYIDTKIAAVNQTLTNEITTVNNVLGAKNLLPNIAQSQTTGGITYTVNSDGSITVNGTSDMLYFYPIYNLNFILPKGKYVLNGCPSGGAENTYRLTLETNSGGTIFDIGEGVEFELLENTIITRCYFRVASGQTFSNAIVKPMIRLASISDDTYVPYAMTNRELTDDATYKKGDTIAISSNPLYLSALFQDSKHLRLTIPINKPISASGATVTINSAQVFNNGNYEEISSGLTATAYKVDGIGLYVVIENAVDFTTFTAFANATIRFSNVSIAFT